MPIPLPEVYTVAATEEKTYESIWILDLSVNARSEAESPEAFIYINYCPYNATTGERQIEASKEITLPLWELVHTYPSVAQALGAVYLAVPDLITAATPVE